MITHLRICIIRDFYSSVNLFYQVLSKEYENIMYLDNRFSIRPTKIAEKYSEVYDNEWTDALETLTSSGRYTEEQIIQILLECMQVSLISISGGQSFVV